MLFMYVENPTYIHLSILPFHPSIHPSIIHSPRPKDGYAPANKLQSFSQPLLFVC